MEVVSACSLPVGWVVWRAQSGAIVASVVAKATFQLASIESRLAAEQDPIVIADRWYRDDPRQGLVAPSDLVPWKRRADVIVVGSAFAPFGDPVRSLVVRLSVAGADKAMECFGDRVFTLEGALREGSRFAKLPLDWHYAAGGPDTPNPVGIRQDAAPDTYGQRLVPRFQPAGMYVTSPDTVIPAIGFGPVSPYWPERWNKLYRHAHGWDPARWMERPLPDDLDPAYFNAAPADQQVDLIRHDERIVLENLHPLLPRLVTNLGAPAPEFVVERPGRPVEAAPCVCDTMWIDTDRQVCVLSWRARILLDSADAPGRVWVTQAGAEPAAPTAVVATSAPVMTGGAPAPSHAGPAAPAGAPAAPPARPGGRRDEPAYVNNPALPLDRFPIERCAAIAASWARRPSDRDAILTENGLTEDDWDALDHHWSVVLKKDAEQNIDRRLIAYDTAFVACLEKERGPITADEYARLRLQEHDRGALARALGDMSLPWGSTQRIHRVFEERIRVDPALRARVEAATKER